jgi:hypothetical protein
LFIALTQSPQAAANAAFIMPASIALLSVFLLGYIALARYGLAKAIIGALVIWFACNALLVNLHINKYSTVIVIYLGLLLSVHCLLRYVNVKSVKPRHVHYTVNMLLIRGLFGGTVIALSVIAAKLGGPLLGGIFASFPAVTLPTLIIVHRSQGYEYTSALSKGLIQNGIINLGIYVIVAHYVYSITNNTLLGTLIAVGSSIIVTLLLWKKNQAS